MAIINSLGQLVGTGALNGSLSGTPAPQYQTQSNQILNVASMAQYKPTDYTRQADGSVILNAGVTPIAGTYKPAPTIPAQLPATDLTTNNPIAPAINSTTAYDEAYAKALGATQSTSLANFQQQQEAQKASDQSTLSASEKAFNDLVAQISNKGTDKKTLENTLGVNDYTKQLADINTQIASKSVEFDTLINQNRDKSINSRIIGGTEDKIIRDRGVELGGLTARAQAMQGNISTAKQTAEDTIAFQYAPLEQELELKKMQLERAYNTFDASEKKRADDLLATIDAQKEQVTAEKAVRSKINDVMISASKNGADAETLKQIMASKDESGAILAAGSFLAPSDFAVNSKTGQLYNKKTGETVGKSVGKVSSGGSAGGSSGANGTSSLSKETQAYYDNPALLSQVTATKRKQIIDEVTRAGLDASVFTKAKPLSDSAIKEITQIESALSSLDDLEQKIKDNLQYIGPIKGLAALNPYSKAKQVQSDIDRVRQVVGKALEGGVLRKEDEEKYKKILSTITDTPENALYKLQQLRTALSTNLSNYQSAQNNAGNLIKTVTGKTLDLTQFDK